MTADSRRDPLGAMAPVEDPLGACDAAAAARLTGDAKRTYVRTLFDRLAPRYDLLNQIVSLGQVPWWRWRALRRLRFAPGARLCDVGCGTGVVTRALRRRFPEAEVVGADLSPGMIEAAAARDPLGRYEVADVTRMAADPRRYDGIVTVFTTRNFPDLDEALDNLCGALAPGGQLLVVDTFRPVGPAWWRGLQAVWMRRVVPALVRPFADPRAFRYLGESILAHVTDDELVARLTQRGCRLAWRARYSFGTASAVCVTREEA